MTTQDALSTLRRHTAGVLKQAAAVPKVGAPMKPLPTTATTPAPGARGMASTATPPGPRLTAGPAANVMRPPVGMGAKPMVSAGVSALAKQAMLSKIQEINRRGKYASVKSAVNWGELAEENLPTVMGAGRWATSLPGRAVGAVGNGYNSAMGGVGRTIAPALEEHPWFNKLFGGGDTEMLRAGDSSSQYYDYGMNSGSPSGENSLSPNYNYGINTGEPAVNTGGMAPNAMQNQGFARLGKRFMNRAVYPAAGLAAVGNGVAVGMNNAKANWQQQHPVQSFLARNFGGMPQYNDKSYLLPSFMQR